MDSAREHSSTPNTAAVTSMERMCDKLDQLSHRMSAIEAQLQINVSADSSIDVTKHTPLAAAGTKDSVPLSVKKDVFDIIYKDDIDASLQLKTWSELDSDLKKRMAQSALDNLKLKGCTDMPSLKDINNNLRQFYTQRRTNKLSSLDKESRTKKRLAAKVNRLNFEKREQALKEAISKGEIDGDDEDSLIQFKQTISPIKRDIIQVYDSDDENSIFHMKEVKKSNLKKAREVKAQKREASKRSQILLNFKPVCTSTQNNFMQDCREPQPWDYGAGYMDRTIDFVGRPYYPGYGPFAEDFKVGLQIDRDPDRTYVETGNSYDFVEDY